MGTWVGLPLLILAAAIQVTFVPQLRVFGGEADLVMLLVLAYARRATLEQGVTWAFIGGLASDLLSSTPTGTHILSLVLLVFVIDRLRAQLSNVGVISTAGLVIVGTLFQYGFSYLANALRGYGLPPLAVFPYNVLPSIAYNLVLIWPLAWFVRRLAFAPTAQAASRRLGE
jgi:rod shape-determining protein MreD